ncbi:hypothetical protein [Sphingobacterium faecale]|uniref:DUF3592 domain-containing protein n=1 Tax=Sphingobacterium faecale TaxID=2803775 RepID=A0ABS1QZL7_9SPHI|nr:hypothetical protein [Sphingobacterium faecale]MBL1407530.1 hypothetical protein [Sphingobacterium faecale]
MKNHIISSTLVPVFGMLIFLTAFTGISFYGCRSSKEKLKKTILHTDDRYTFERREWQQDVLEDTTYRYWSFLTDSTFFFHPDSGLWASRGTVYMEDQSAFRRYHNYDASQANRAIHVQEQLNTQKGSKVSYSIWKIILPGIAVIMVVLFFLLKKK